MKRLDPYGLDGQKLAYHPERVGRWLEAGDDWEKLKKVYPIYVEVSPTGACNHRCRFCALDFRGYRSEELPSQILTSRLKEMASCGVKSVMFAGEGEPLLYKDLASVIREAHIAGIDCALTTNGSLMTESFLKEVLPHLSWLRVSLDAGRPQTYAYLHRTSEDSFERVISNLRLAVKIKASVASSCTLGAQVLLLPENRGEILEAASLMKDVGLDYLVVKPYSRHPSSLHKDWANLPYHEVEKLQEELSSNETQNFKMILRLESIRRSRRNKSYPHCLSTPFFWAYLSNDGNLYSCSVFLGDKRFLLGSLKKRTFKEVWESEERRKNYLFLRKLHVNSVCRKNCRMEACNEYLWSLKNPPPHVNFI